MTATAVDPEEGVDLLLRDLGTLPGGLAEREAARRLQQHGPNEIQRREGQGHLRALALQFTHPLALLLWVAGALALAASLTPLAVAIAAVILLNALFAFVQELQAERATEALGEFLPAHARVLRDGAEREIDARELVPGDVVLLSEGDRLSADARLVDGAVELDMSPLTGESQPVARSSERARPAPSPLESDDLVFAGTLCTAGEAVAVVFATGMATQLGRIAALSQRVRAEVSPLQAQVNRAAWMIAGFAVVAGVGFLAVGTTVAGLPLEDSVTFAIGLLVANVPEGLLPTITLALAVGVRRMARRRALIKRLTAVETLGSTDVICTDKTGTLTEGRMAVHAFWAAGRELGPADAADEPFAALLRTAVRCNNATAFSGDPGERALLAAAAELGVERAGTRERLFHFDPRLKRMTTLDREPDGTRWLHAKGAPLELLERCDIPLDAGERARIVAAFEAYARRGLRVLGFAERRVEDAGPADREAAETGLTFVGLAALQDPPRPDVPDAVRACRRANIRIIVITGDHGLTAAAVARQVGIAGENARVVYGPEIDAMAEPALEALLRDEPELIIARSSPETKLRVVDALRDAGHIVAMTGDGVNDAPALRRADIGVAMGASGTEVAREAATMVLTDDSFASIVAAIREGRVVYDNIRKFVTYIFAHATPEVVPFLVYALSGGAIPLPITVMQILAIDLGTETLPALALGREPPEPGIMDRPPRPRERGILDRPMLVRAWLWLGVLEAALVMGAFIWGLEAGYATATTMTFAGITFCQVGTAFACRTSYASLRSIGVFSNRLLLWGIAFELAFAAAVIYLPPLQAVFGTHALGLRELAPLLTFPFIVWGSDELRRRWLRARSFHGCAGGDPGRGSMS